MCVTPTIYLDFCSYRDEQYLGDTEANVPLRSEHWHQTVENDINQQNNLKHVAKDYATKFLITITFQKVTKVAAETIDCK